MFFQGNHSHVIIIEDDMLFSPDFLALFEATAPLLELDPSLWCISSWNDNGLSSFAWNASRLVRTFGWKPKLPDASKAALSMHQKLTWYVSLRALVLHDNGLSSFAWNASRLVWLSDWAVHRLSRLPLHSAGMRSTA